MEHPTRVPGRASAARTWRAPAATAAMALVLTSLVAVSAPASADTVTDTSIAIDFTADGYEPGTPGAPGGQNGWARGWNQLDNEIVDGKLRISNAEISGVQTQLVAPGLDVSAGHPEEGAEFDVFEATFRVAAVGGEFQPGLRLEIAPDDGAGSRTGGSFVFYHNPSSGKLEIGALWSRLGYGTAESGWFNEVLAAVDPTVPHEVTLRHTFIEDGQDAVDVVVDGVLVGTVGTYEEYHLVDPGSSHDPRRDINTLLFRSSQAIPTADGKYWDLQPAVPETEGKGFLIDQIAYSVSKSGPVATPVTVDPRDVGLQGDDPLAPWVRAHGSNAPGRYEFVYDSEKGGALELETIAGDASVGTQARLLHYFHSGAYVTDEAAVSLPGVVIGGQELRSLPLSTLIHSPIRAIVSSATTVAVQIEVVYGGDKYTTLYRNVGPTEGWETLAADPDAPWITSRALTAADDSPILAAGGKLPLAEIAASLASQTPRAFSIGLNKGRDSNPVNAGVARVAGLAFLDQQFTFVTVPSRAQATVASQSAPGQVTVTWDAPEYDGGLPVTGYRVTLSDGETSRVHELGASTTVTTFGALAPSGYTATVAAHNAVGLSEAASAVVTVTPAPVLSVPAAPGAPVAVADGAAGVKVSWSTPADGGSPISLYTVALRSAGGDERVATVGAGTLSHTFAGLPAGTYSATVAAVNAVGSSPASPVSAAVTLKSAVRVFAPIVSKSSQSYRTASPAKVTAYVAGAESGRVVFYSGTRSLGAANLVNGVATRTLPKALAAGTHRITAKFEGSATAQPATSPATTFKVGKAKLAKPISVKGKAFRTGKRPVVTIKLGRYDYRKIATGKVRISVGGKVYRTVTVKAAHKGKISVRLPKASKNTKVKVRYLGDANHAARNSATATLRVGR